MVVQMNAGRIFERTVESRPDRTAIVDPVGGDRYTYAEWGERVSTLAGALEELGIAPGDRVAVAVENRPEAAALYWAIQLTGAVYAPFNMRTSAEEVAVVFDRLDPVAVFVSAIGSDAVLRAVGDDPEVVYIGDDPPSDVVTWEGFRDLATGGFEPTFVGPETESVIFQTSGTTGRPKSVPHTHRSAYTTPRTIAFEALWRHGDSILPVLPLYHMAGLQTLTTCTVATGTWIAQQDFSIEAVLATIDAEAPTYLYSVPTVFHGIVEHEDREQYDLTSIDKIQYAGALMTEPLQRRVREVFDPDEFINYYGSSELHNFAVCTWLDEKPTCTGRACIDTRLRVVDPTEASPANPASTVDSGDLGEVIADASSPGTFDGYIDDPEETEASFRDGWYYTGDLGYKDEDGDLWLVGRVDDMIISGGENIAPIEVEAALEDHGLVGDVGVTGEPDEKWGQIVVAYVTPPSDGIGDYDDAAASLETSLRDGDTLPDFKRPRRYVFVESLPTSDVGKKLRGRLSDLPPAEILASIER